MIDLLKGSVPLDECEATRTTGYTPEDKDLTLCCSIAVGGYACTCGGKSALTPGYLDVKDLMARFAPALYIK